MRLDDTLTLIQTESGYDECLNPDEITTEISIGKCKILPNGSASKTRGNDGNEYIYAYTIMVRNPAIIVKEGARIHIVKSDGTVDKVMTVRGFVTLKRWEKIWV